MNVNRIPMLAAFLVAACGGDDDELAPRGGQVTAPWDDMCLLTFSKDHDIVDSFFDEVDLSIRAGDSYLQAASTIFGDSIIFISPQGPVELDLGDEVPEPPPYTSSCEGTRTVEYVSVFVDTVVYSDVELTTPICTLSAGTRAPGNLGFGAIGGSLTDAGKYEVSFQGLEAHCAGASQGFVRGVQVTIGMNVYAGPGLVTALAPIGLQPRP